MMLSRQLPGDANHQDTHATTKQSNPIFPLSEETLEKFLGANDLVHTVHLFRGKDSVQVMTDNGRFLLQAIMSEISEQHSENICWDGAFSIADILVLKFKHGMEIKIQKDHIKVEGEARQLQARVQDIISCGEIFISPYKNKYGVLPVFLDSLNEDLAGATPELVKMKWFMEYLTYHAAIMPTSGRTHLEKTLGSKNPNVLKSIVLAKPAAYPNNWKTIVKSTKGGSITLLHDVYFHDNPCTADRPDKYDSTVRGLIRFLRNVLEHGKRHVPGGAEDCELELYLAKMFPSFLPALMQTLLQQQITKTSLGDMWSSFKVFKSEKWDQCCS